MNLWLDGPHIMTMPDMVVVTAGERLALQCAVIKGGLPLALTWRKEEASTLAVVSGLSIKLINDFTVSLTVESLTDQHAGRYTCLARNDAGRAHFTVTVVVQGKNRGDIFANFFTFQSILQILQKYFQVTLSVPIHYSGKK